MEKKTFVKFKEDRQKESLHLMHPLLVMVLFDMAWWCFKRKIKFVVTDTISSIRRDLKLGRKHSGHRDMRAFDLRSWTFSPAQQDEFMDHYNEKYKDIAQISSSDGVPRLVVLHGEGDNEHFHIGLNLNFKV